jgi:NAD(P)-dependent dehydrogenase (short-subunit alcohol dehydrogenase family)
MSVAVITGISGQLGPVWHETLSGMGYGVEALDLPSCDISIKEKVEARKNEIILCEGIPKVIVLNAAIDNPPGSDASFHGNLERILQVNLIGSCNVVEAFLPSMIKNGGGTIIAIGSIMGFIGADWRNYAEGWEKPVGYNLSKAALMQYMRSLTVQYGRYGIRGCCIAFGPYDGGKLNKEFLDKFLRNVPLGRPISKESCKAALRFAVACPEFAGQTALVDGGYTSL